MPAIVAPFLVGRLVPKPPINVNKRRHEDMPPYPFIHGLTTMAQCSPAKRLGVNLTSINLMFNKSGILKALSSRFSTCNRSFYSRCLFRSCCPRRGGDMFRLPAGPVLSAAPRNCSREARSSDEGAMLNYSTSIIE